MSQQVGDIEGYQELDIEVSRARWCYSTPIPAEPREFESELGLSFEKARRSERRRKQAVIAIGVGAGVLAGVGGFFLGGPLIAAVFAITIGCGLGLVAGAFMPKVKVKLPEGLVRRYTEALDKKDEVVRQLSPPDIKDPNPPKPKDVAGQWYAEHRKTLSLFWCAVQNSRFFSKEDRKTVFEMTLALVEADKEVHAAMPVDVAKDLRKRDLEAILNREKRL